MPAPDTGTLRGDLRALAVATFEAAQRPPAAPALRTLVREAARDPHLAELMRTFTESRRAAVHETLERGRQRGELPAGRGPRPARRPVLRPLLVPLPARTRPAGRGHGDPPRRLPARLSPFTAPARPGPPRPGPTPVASGRRQRERAPRSTADGDGGAAVLIACGQRRRGRRPGRPRTTALRQADPLAPVRRRRGGRF
ncbi:TetR-like C-terminal domain-containing protein [Streptomyces echinatus]|uniref:TetR-like C-terminal domain-containing protein n=1 Tax=Streptomyces echinatus TaxID=67293 RepID=UPI003822837E